MATTSTEASFRVKWQIPDDSAPAVATVLQNSGGPCPLLALANALLLRRAIAIPPNTQSLSEEHLLGCVCQTESLIEHMDVLPKLGKEVAVDPCFSGTTDFVPSPELSVFEAANIRLVHGAIPDPHDDVVVECVSPLSYNQVCDRLVAAAVQADEAHGSPERDSDTARDDETTLSLGSLECNVDAEEVSKDISQVRDGDSTEAHDSAPSIAVAVDAICASDSVVQTSEDDAATEEPEEEAAGAALEDELASGIWTGPPHLKPEVDSDLTSDAPRSSSDTTDSGMLIARNAPFVQAFLDDTASMMTFHGLSLLHQTLEEGELACLFYNNHFSVLTMNKKRLFMLVTDEGYIRAPNVVYEGLCDLDGNTAFFDAKFQPVDLATNVVPGSASVQGSGGPSRQAGSAAGSHAYATSRQTRPPGTASYRTGGSSSTAARVSKKLSKKTCSLQ